ncbi:MAG TPA: RNA polymerase sigma factor [Mycobacteriales bacterium]|nr:RNA polymerase sigma factor [Mycobacteriales bacterium]
MSTAQDLPVPYGDPAHGPALRLVPSEPLDFDAAVRAIRPRLHRYAVRRLGDLHEAEELVQEALLRAYTHRAQLMTEDDIAAWTTVVTGRLVIDRLRVRGRSTTMADVPESGRVSRDTADHVVARDEARMALDALDAMPTRQAALLWAREVEGQSYEELCARFAMTEPAVRSVLTRARKALRKEYGARGGTLPVGGLAILAPWVAGLGWADRLRRAAARLTAPAALGAVGVTALGGLVLSPFGFLPANPEFRPAPALSTSQDEEPRLHAPTFLTAAAQPAPAAAGTAPRADTVHALLPASLRDTVETCVNDVDSDDGNNTIDLTQVTDHVPGLDPTAGSGRCDAAESTAGTDLIVHMPEALGGEDLTVTVPDEVQCTPMPGNPVLTCASSTQHSTQQGATR